MRIKNLGPPSKNIIDKTKTTTVYRRPETGFGKYTKVYKNENPKDRKADREDDPAKAVKKTYRKQ